MDKMNIDSKFTTGIISKIVSTVIKKKFGYDVQPKLNSINITIDDGKMHVHLDADIELSKDELDRMLIELIKKNETLVFESDNRQVMITGLNERKNHEH